jgi:hypothetical protein
MQIDETKYPTDKLMKDMHELKVENRIQTIAVVLFFFFGVATIYDISNKIKNK